MSFLIHFLRNPFRQRQSLRACNYKVSSRDTGKNTSGQCADSLISRLTASYIILQRSAANLLIWPYKKPKP